MNDYRCTSCGATGFDENRKFRVCQFCHTVYSKYDYNTPIHGGSFAYMPSSYSSSAVYEPKREKPISAIPVSASGFGPYGYPPKKEGEEDEEGGVIKRIKSFFN